MLPFNFKDQKALNEHIRIRPHTAGYVLIELNHEFKDAMRSGLCLDQFLDYCSTVQAVVRTCLDEKLVIANEIPVLMQNAIDGYRATDGLEAERQEQAITALLYTHASMSEELEPKDQRVVAQILDEYITTYSKNAQSIEDPNERRDAFEALGNFALFCAGELGYPALPVFLKACRAAEMDTDNAALPAEAWLHVLHHEQHEHTHNPGTAPDFEAYMHSLTMALEQNAFAAKYLHSTKFNLVGALLPLWHNTSERQHTDLLQVVTDSISYPEKQAGMEFAHFFCEPALMSDEKMNDKAYSKALAEFTSSILPTIYAAATRHRSDTVFGTGMCSKVNDQTLQGIKRACIYADLLEVAAALEGDLPMVGLTAEALQVQSLLAGFDGLYSQSKGTDAADWSIEADRFIAQYKKFDESLSSILRQPGVTHNVDLDTPVKAGPRHEYR